MKEAKPCVVCGELFMVNGARTHTCSKQCSRIHCNEVAKAITRGKREDRYIDYWFRSCVVCHARFVTKNSRTVCCSPKCKQYRHTIATLLKAGVDTSKSIVCPECGKVERYELGKCLGKFCSSGCSRRYHKRIAHQKRRAVLRGAFVESVDPLEVFKRDGYCCHLCGRRVDMKRLGMHTGNAPEMDHIVPLSKGGKHCYENVACSCSACNNSKRDKIIGQLRIPLMASA